MLATIGFAANGDTTYLKVFDKYHMGYYGNHNMKALAPNTNFKSQRIWMKYTIGCTSNGQCEWDYTIKVSVRQHTGKNDSTLKQAPSFKLVGGAAKDTIIYYSTDSTYQGVFNSITKKTDSVATAMLKIAMFRDTLNPLVCTDTLKVWPTNYYRYSFDTTGKKIDSVLVPISQTLHIKYKGYYNVFEVTNDFELGRMISPYAKAFPKTFAFEHMYDVTDFATLLHDSVEIVINYGGYSWGFTSTVEFYFVEGTPAREAIGLDVIYNNYYNYGQTTSIENALTSKKFTMPANAVSAKARVCITGHGGESNENCSEFCAKSFYLKLNKNQIATELVWKDNCGSNAIINQGGTWIYDRANWCPGEKIKLFEYPLNITPGSTDSMDMDMDDFTANGGAGYHITTYVVYYGANNRTIDAGIEDIIAPSRNYQYNRMNPICDNARIVLKNFGTQPLTSAEITYQVGNASPVKGLWVGNLAFDKTTEVQLPYINWSSDSTNMLFKVWISKINYQNISLDENPTNNSMTSVADIPMVLPSSFYIETTTNTKPSENSYTIKDASGKIIYNRSFTKVSTFHRDTINLGLGCYTFEMADKGGNGMSFWANSDGSGALRIRNANSPLNIIKTFNADFGNFMQLNFTVMFKLGVQENTAEILKQTTIYPSPASDKLYIDSKAGILDITIIDLSGRSIMRMTNLTEDNISVSEYPSGIYFVKLTDLSGNTIVKKISISHQ